MGADGAAAAPRRTREDWACRRGNEAAAGRGALHLGGFPDSAYTAETTQMWSSRPAARRLSRHVFPASANEVVHHADPS